MKLLAPLFCIMIAACNLVDTSPQKINQGLALVDTVSVSSNTQYPSQVYTNYVLELGVSYLVEVSGVYWANAWIWADAKYSQRLFYADGETALCTSTIVADPFVSDPPNCGPGWYDLVPSYELYGSTLLELLIDGTAQDWGDFNSDHIYTTEVIGNGQPLGLSIEDLGPNNQGSLTVRVYEHSDEDGDGISNSDDDCPDSSPSDVVDAHRCSIYQICEGPWNNHGQCVSCFAQVSQDFWRADLITRDERQRIRDNAAHQDSEPCSLSGSD